MTATVVISARVHPCLRGNLDRKARRLGLDRNAALICAVQDWTDDPRSEAERAQDADLADLQATYEDLRGGLHG